MIIEWIAEIFDILVLESWDWIVRDALAVNIEFFFGLSSCLFVGGLFLICTNRKNLLLLVIGIELMLLGITLSYIISSIIFNLPESQIYAFMILTIAAAESAIGLGMLIAAFRTKKSLNFIAFNSLKR